MFRQGGSFSWRTGAVVGFLLSLGAFLGAYADVGGPGPIIGLAACLGAFAFLLASVRRQVPEQFTERTIGPRYLTTCKTLGLVLVMGGLLVGIGTLTIRVLIPQPPAGAPVPDFARLALNLRSFLAVYLVPIIFSFSVIPVAWGVLLYSGTRRLRSVQEGHEVPECQGE
jgi:hypothetical protein